MVKKLLLVAGMILLVASLAAAQEYKILWEDHFEDDDLHALHNVGWIYYHEPDITGQVIEQRDGALFVEAGSYGGLVGVGLVQTNGIPQITWDEDMDPSDGTVDSLLMNKWSSPNQILTFQVNFVRFTTSQLLALARMPIDSSRGDASPTDVPAYVLVLSPLMKQVNLAKYEGEMAALAPESWTYFNTPGDVIFDFELEVFYWVKWYLNEGDLKCKVWEGDPEDEPEDWMLEVVDPEPRVTGKFNTFATFGAPPVPGQGDQYILDDIVVRSSELSSTHPVTFQCNMNIQTQGGTFDPATDKLVARGSFNGWAGDADELTDPDGDGIYTMTVEMDESLVGTEVDFKYVIAPDNWESVENRKFTLLSGGQVLDVVYFNNQEKVLVTAMVTFQADMSDMLDKGWFDPATDSMRVVGGMNSWGNTESMEPDPFDPSLYIYDMDVTASVDDVIGWKFRGYPNDHFLDGGWEAGAGHEFTFTGSDLVLDAVKPDVLPAGSPLSQDVAVRFSVDVNDAQDWYNKQPFQNISSVWVTGDWNNWGGSWSVADTATLIKLYDDGMTEGDATAGDGIWTGEDLFAAGTAATHLYKYAIVADGVDTLNGGTESLDNEAGFSMNHFMLIDDTNPGYILPTDIFGSQWKGTSVDRKNENIVPSEFSLQQNYPNPFNPTTDISYSLAKEVIVNLSIYNSLGQKIATLVDQKQSAGTHNATWLGIDQTGAAVTSGVYFYRLEAGDYASTMKMLFLK